MTQNWTKTSYVHSFLLFLCLLTAAKCQSRAAGWWIITAAGCDSPVSTERLLHFRAGMQGFFPPGAGVPHRQQRLYTQLIKHGRSWKGKRRQQEIQAGCLPWSGRSTRRVKSFFQPDTTSFSDIVEKFFHGEPVLKHFNVTPGLDIIKWSSGGHVGI